MFANLGYLICVPFAWLLRVFYSLFHSYGLAILFFTLAIKLVMLPLQIKSKRSMIRMSHMNSQLEEIRAKYANNTSKMNEEVQKLYEEQGVNPMGGCLWSFLPLPILIALYNIIRQPIVYLMFFGGRSAGFTVLEEAKQLVEGLGLTWTTLSNGADGSFAQIEIVRHITDNLNAPSVQAFLTNHPNWVTLDFHFLGIDLAAVPSQVFGMIGEGITWAVAGLIAIPIISALSQVAAMKISTIGQPVTEAAASTNRTMMIMMPLMSLWIGFTLPAALGVYWIAQSVVTGVQELLLGRFLNKKIEEEEAARAEALAADRKRRMEEAKRNQEWQRQQAAKKQTLREKQQAAQDAKELKAKKAERSTTEAGRIGDRPYARGRSYKADRYD